MGLIRLVRQWQKARYERNVGNLTAQAADLKEDQQYNLLILYQRGFVRAKANGQSITRIDADIENLIRKKIKVTVKPGTYFVSSGKHQNMATTEEYTFTLLPCSTKRLEINAACINAKNPIPRKRDRFEGVSKVSQNIIRFLEASKGMDPMVIQAGVWTLTDNYSRHDVINHLVKTDSRGNTSHPITHAHCNKAKTILDRLGISHRLWHSSLPYEKKTQKYDNGTYVGEFRYGDHHGRGKCTWAEGTSYDGDWKNGEKHGHGIYTFKDGTSYDGEWQNNQKHGHGVYTFNDGGRYVGEFEADRESGGWYYFPNGTKRWCLRDTQGKWVNSTPIPTKEQQNIAPSNLSPLSSFPSRGTPTIAPLPPVHKGASLLSDEIYGAARKGDLEKIQVLLKRNPNLVFKKNYNGWTPLHYAADSGQFTVVKLLLANKADVDAKTSEGKTPLHFTALNGSTGVVELLLDNKADVNAKDNSGESPLHRAAVNGHKEIAEWLLVYNADVNARDNDRKTPLYSAALNGHNEVAKLLIANNADVNAKDHDGNTTLHRSSKYGYKDLVKLLLENKADVNAKNNRGDTPLRLVAARGGQNEVAELLRQHGGH